jgi:hypothetical protein
MSATEPPLRIRVVDLASERAGVPDGIWIRADQDPAEIEAAIDEWLSKSPFDVSEGAAVREHEGFGEIVFSGDESLEIISRLALLIRRYGPVFIEILKRIYSGEARYVAEAERIFDDHYTGAFASMAEWGRQFANQMDLECDELLQPYVDWAAFAVDSEEGGHFTTVTDARGKVHVFRR